MMRAGGLSQARRLLVIVVLLAGFLAPVPLARAQGEITTVVPAPDLPGVPGDVPVVGFTTLDLAGGDYQWQTTSRETLARNDDPIEVHNGFLLSIDQAIVVQKAGAPSRPVPAGQSLPLAEGERVKPVASGETPGRIVIVEFVALDDLRPDEAPDQTLPLTLDAGTYTLALLDITNLGEDGPSPGQVIVEAAGPGFAITSTDDPAAGGIPLVVWLASIFRTGDVGADTPEAAASPTEADEVEATEAPGDGPAPAATEEDEGDEPVPDATEEEPDAEATDDDSGSLGEGPAPAPTEGDEGEDEPDAVPTEAPADGEATGEEPESEAPTTPADASGQSTTAPVLPGVPEEIPVLAWAELELPAGEYQWQSRSLQTLTRADDPITVHNGFLIAVDQTVIVLKAGAPSQPVPAGTGVVLAEGDRILPTGTGETPGNVVILELVAVADVGAGEEPDQVLPLELEAGTYTLALLDISGVAEGGPAPGEIIAEAAGPGFGISAAEELGETPDPEELDWIVGIFPA